MRAADSPTSEGGRTTRQTRNIVLLPHLQLADCCGRAACARSLAGARACRCRAYTANVHGTPETATQPHLQLADCRGRAAACCQVVQVPKDTQGAAGQVQLRPGHLVELWSARHTAAADAAAAAAAGGGATDTAGGRRWRCCFRRRRCHTEPAAVLTRRRNLAGPGGGCSGYYPAAAAAAAGESSATPKRGAARCARRAGARAAVVARARTGCRCGGHCRCTRVGAAAMSAPVRRGGRGRALGGSRALARGLGGRLVGARRG